MNVDQLLIIGASVVVLVGALVGAVLGYKRSRRERLSLEQREQQRAATYASLAVAGEGLPVTTERS